MEHNKIKYKFKIRYTNTIYKKDKKAPMMQDTLSCLYIFT